VVHNGRLSGVRKALGAALTLLGRAEGCEVRLNVEGVLPIHCAIVRTPDGLVLRALPGAAVLVNGQSVVEAPLDDGDVLTVGPFQFLVAAPVAPESLDPAALEREKDALRIQAAAVAAQQVALTEDEARLQHRRGTLERQEAQLSAHLEERRQKLVELQTQVREARMALRNERAEHEKRVTETTAELQRERREMTAGQEKLQASRQQLSELYHRLKRRHAARWTATESGVKKREGRLAADQGKLEADRAALTEARLRCNGEAELGRRKLHDAWDDFHRAEKQWEERRGREDAELRRRAREIAEGERILAEQCQYWEQTRGALQAEVEGLENRVRNLRRKVQEQEKAVGSGSRQSAVAATVDSLPPAGSVVSGSRQLTADASVGPLPPADGHCLLDPLEALAGELADQRWHLLEHAARLARAQQEWCVEQAAALAALHEAGRRVAEREAQIEPREHGLADAEMELQRRARAVAQLQSYLDGWQARLTARAAAFDAQREALLADVRAREEAALRRGDALAKLRQRWTQRRQKEVAALRGELSRCAAARRQFAALWEECLNHGAALEQQQRAAAERALALEQYRLEVIGRAPDAAAAEKRLERLRRRCAAPTVAARRNLDRERQALDGEHKRLQELAGVMDQHTASLAEREAELARRLAEWEHSTAAADEARDRLQVELQVLTAQRARHEQEAQTLRDEVERLARLLMDDGPTILPATPLAA